MSGVPYTDWPVEGEPALTKEYTKRNLHMDESIYRCAWLSAMAASTHAPLALEFPLEKMETWMKTQSHNQSVMSSDDEET